MNLTHILACHIRFSCANLSIQDRGIRPYYIFPKSPPRNHDGGSWAWYPTPNQSNSASHHHQQRRNSDIHHHQQNSTSHPKSSSRPHTLVSQSRKTLSLFVFLSAIGSVSYVNICEMCDVLPPSSSNMFF